MLARSITTDPITLELAKSWVDSREVAHAKGVMGLKPKGSMNPYDTLVVNK